MTRFQRALRLAILGAGLCAACGEAPQRVAGPASPQQDLPARFAGSVRLQGALAKLDSGSLFLIVRPPGSRVPSLARKYEIGDPAFSTDGAERQLRFALDERDSMFGEHAPMFDEMEVEARFDPDGIVDTDDGVVRASARARPGDREVSIVLTPGPGDGAKTPADAPIAGAAAPKDS